jgi:hypothetical protein
LFANTLPTPEVTNSFVDNFGQNFSSFSLASKVHFCVSLAQANLRQEDIFAAVIEELSHIQDFELSDFQTLHFPILNSLLHLDLALDTLYLETTKECDKYQNLSKAQLLGSLPYPSKLNFFCNSVACGLDDQAKIGALKLQVGEIQRLKREDQKRFLMATICLQPRLEQVDLHRYEGAALRSLQEIYKRTGLHSNYLQK